MMIADIIPGFDPLSLLLSSREVIVNVLAALILLLSAASGLWIGGMLWKLWRVIVERLGFDDDDDYGIPSDDAPLSEYEEITGDELEDFKRVESGEMSGEEYAEKWLWHHDD